VITFHAVLDPFDPKAVKLHVPKISCLEEITDFLKITSDQGQVKVFSAAQSSRTAEIRWNIILDFYKTSSSTS
jgi:hypothetical protein